MSLWISSLLLLVLLHTVQAQTEMVTTRSLVLTKKDREVTQAYADVFHMLSDDNACSAFYGGSHTATTVLNDLVSAVESHRLLRDLTFRMSGSPRLLRDPVTGASYRLFERVIVNTDGSFYQRRLDTLVRFPSDVGSYPPGTRPARALILLHELGHLIQGKNGDWLIPNDGHDGARSQRNTLRVQKACRIQLQKLN
jgi:hypothetical protein